MPFQKPILEKTTSQKIFGFIVKVPGHRHIIFHWHCSQKTNNSWRLISYLHAYWPIFAGKCMIASDCGTNALEMKRYLFWKWTIKAEIKKYSHYSLSKLCRLVFTWNFFLQNLESPLNNLKEKKQKKLYISYCIEKKIIIMLVEYGR